MSHPTVYVACPSVVLGPEEQNQYVAVDADVAGPGRGESGMGAT